MRVCDAPARAFLKNVKGHTGYHGCEQCTQDGVYQENRNYIPLKMNKSFKNKKDSDHHHGTSPLKETFLDMVSGFPLDDMHLVCFVAEDGSSHLQAVRISSPDIDRKL